MVTIHVLGNLQAFQHGLVGIQMLFNPANNTAWAGSGSVFGGGGLVLVGLLVTALVIATKGIFTQRLELHHVFLLAVLYGILFVPTTTVNLDDVLSGQQAVVDGIPVGIAYPAAIASSLAYDAGQQISQAFQSVTTSVPPTDISQGFVAPLQTLFDMRSVYGAFTKANPMLATSVMDYAEYCGNVNGLQSLNNSTNTMAALFSNPPTNQQTITYWINGPLSQAQTVSCQSDADNLKVAMSDYLNDQATQGENVCAPGVPQPCLTTCSQVSGKLTSGSLLPAQNCSSVETQLNNVLVDAQPGVGTMLTAAGTNATNFLTNIFAGCLASQGFTIAQNPYGDTGNPTLPEYCGIDTANLDYQQIINAASANSFEQNMLPMMSVLQFMFFALTPLVAGVMVMMGSQGFGMAAKYMMFGAWTQSWLPAAIVISDWQQLSAGNVMAKMGLALASQQGGSTSALLVQPANLAQVFEKVAITLSTSNMLLAMVPLLTFALLSGSYMAMASVGKALDGGASTKNSDAFNTTADGAAKAYGVSANAAGEYFQTNPLAQSASVNIGSAAQSSISAMRSQADNTALSAMQSAGRTGSSVWSVMDQAQHNTAAAKDLSATGGQQWADTFKSVQGFAHETGLSDSQAASFLAQVGAGLNSGMSMAGLLGKADQFLANAGVKANLSGEERGQIQNALKHSDVQKTARDLSSQHTASLAQQVAQKYQIGDQASKSGGLTRQAQQTEQETQQAQQQYQRAEQLQQQFSKTGMLGSGLNLSASTLAGTLLARYGSAPAAISAANSMAARAGVGDAYDKAVTAGKASGMSSETAAAYGLVMALPRAKNAAGFEQIADLAGAEMPAGAAVAGDQIAATQNSVNLAAGQFHAPDQSKVSDKGFKALKKEETNRQKAYQPVNQTGVSPNQTPMGLYDQGLQEVSATPVGGIDPKKAAAEVTGNPMVEGAQFMAEHPVGTMVAGMAADALGGVAAGKAAWGKYKAWKNQQTEKTADADKPASAADSFGQDPVDPGAPAQLGADDPSIIDVEARVVPDIEALGGNAEAAAADIGSAALDIAGKLAVPVAAAQMALHADDAGAGEDADMAAKYKAAGIDPNGVPSEGSAKAGDK